MMLSKVITRLYFTVCRYFLFYAHLYIAISVTDQTVGVTAAPFQ